MANPFPGRRESFGLGKESTPGTAVSPTTWIPHIQLTLEPKTDQVANESALGRLESTNDSAVVSQWAEGSLQAKLNDISTIYLLYNLLGSLSTAANADGSGTIKDHTITVNNSTTPPSLTLARVNPVESLRYALGEVTDFELEAVQGDWVKFTASLMAKLGASAADTAAYPSPLENEFTSKHVTVKLASNVAGLSGATALDIKSVKLKITAPSDKWVPFGALDPTSFDPQDIKVTGEIVLRFTNATYEALGNANTRQAMSITLKNTDVTIGTSANPTLVFTMPKIRLSPLTLDNDLSKTINQTYEIKAELDTSAGYLIQVVATNTKSSY